MDEPNELQGHIAQYIYRRVIGEIQEETKKVVSIEQITTTLSKLDNKDIEHYLNGWREEYGKDCSCGGGCDEY